MTTEQNVVTAVGLDGFFIQTPAVRSDGDIDTSDGIFVFTGSAPTVAVGDLVDVTGVVSEFFDFTEITAPDVTITGVGTIPAAVIFDAAVPSPDPNTPSCAIEFECYEGMLVQITGGSVTGPHQEFGGDPIAEVHITAAPMRTFREPGIEFPGEVGFPVWDGNPEVFELDNDALGLPNDVIAAGSTFDAVGVIGFEFGGYELFPSTLTIVDEAVLPRPVRARVEGEVTVGSLNLFRLFDDIDDPSDTNFFGETRDDAVVDAAEYAVRKSKFVQHIMEVLDSPDVLAVQEAEKLGVLQDLAADIAAVDPAVVYSAHLIEGNDIGTIDVGFLVRDTVAVDAITQLGFSETYIDPSDGSDDILHDRPPLLLEGRCLVGGAEVPLTVMVVHNRSLSGVDGGDGERVRQKRFEQAQSIAQKVQDIQDADPAVNLIVTGDFNAFEFTDGYVDAVGQIRGDYVPADNLVCDTNSCDDLVTPDLTNLVDTIVPVEERYSFNFGGNAQVLDHALVSDAALLLVSGAEYGRGNSDGAEILIEDDTTAITASDHDGLVVFLAKNIDRDADGDGVADSVDVCADTVIPESVPTRRLLRKHFALKDGDTIFDTPGGFNIYTTQDTAGCSCEQIIDELGLGGGQVMFGCTKGTMQNWVNMVNP